MYFLYIYILNKCL